MKTVRVSKKDRIIVGRPVNGISINGLEWLLTKNGKIKTFKSTKEAKKFINKKFAFSEEELEDLFIYQNINPSL